MQLKVIIGGFSKAIWYENKNVKVNGVKFDNEKRINLYFESSKYTC